MTLDATGGVSCTIELLVPSYTELPKQEGAEAYYSVALHRTTDNWLQLVFAGPDVRKNVTCINGPSCRCFYASFLKKLLMLDEQHVLAVDVAYVVIIGVATLQVRVRVHEDAKHSTSLKDFDLVLCHLRSPALEILQCNEQARKKARNAALEDAKNSSCHVVGCRLHSLDKADQPKRSFNLPDVFRNLVSQNAVDQMEIRDDATYVGRMTCCTKKFVMTDLPTNVLQHIVCLMSARDFASLSGVCSLFQHLAYEVVPGLNLVLYAHQRRGLKWMLRRETPSLTCKSRPHPFVISSESNYESATAIDLIENKVIAHPHVIARDACGGMFCDEPGLGKTITMLALILRTKGQMTNKTPGEPRKSGQENTRLGLRSSSSRGRSVNVNDLITSRASLIVAPDPLVEHWKYQIEAHVAQSALRVFIDPGIGHKLPLNVDLAQYDVVVMSFTRLAREWKLHRPTSALETRMPERFGFEGQERYADGTLRGSVSSLLTVHWVRVIVDEGHKLGGQTPSDLMQLARMLYTGKRWVMTGTPTPNTLQSADLRYMHGLLVFLRTFPYGSSDGQAWGKAIARPFERNELIGFYRLQHLLSRIMIRHTKDSISEVLPKPIRRTVYINPTPSEYAQYNGVAAAVRANLVITNMDPKTPGEKHPDSLLNPINRKDAMRVVSNLRSACCGGSAVKVSLAEWSRLDTINMLSALNVSGENMGIVIEYLRKVQFRGNVTQCGCCKRKLQLLMIIPCGHLCCADCVEDRMKSVGPSCYRCSAVFDREAFQRLQPGFEFEMVEAETPNINIPQNGHNGRRDNPIQHFTNQNERPNVAGQDRRIRARNQRGHDGNDQNTPRLPRRALDLTRDIHFIDASKAFYAATRIKELEKEFLHRRMNSSGRSRQRQARDLKAIIFSQFKDHIWHTKVAFAQQGIPTADFIAGLSSEFRMKQLARFRRDPNVNVLLLTEVGSHGLDLSFVTHIFLMDEIWDKSLEQQVISRAHRMGANEAVVVEQLWMRGSVESHMLMSQETIKNQVEVTESSLVNVSSSCMKSHESISPRTFPKKNNTGGGTMFTASSKKRKSHRAAGDTRAAANKVKNSFLQRKIDFVLNKLRLLEEDIVAEPGQVRYSVENDQKEILCQAIRVMPNRGAFGISDSIPQTPLPTLTPVPAVPLSTVETTARPGPLVRRNVSFGIAIKQPSAEKQEVISIDSSFSSSDECDECMVGYQGKAYTERKDNIKVMMERNGQGCRAKYRKLNSLIGPCNEGNEHKAQHPDARMAEAETAHIVHAKAKTVSLIIIDDDDSETESE